MLATPKFRSKQYEQYFRKYVEKILERKDVIGILVFGSVAKGLEKPFPESDIDVLVLAKNLPQNPSIRRLATLKYRKDIGIVEDVWLTPKELLNAVEGGWGVILDALADGIIVYDKEKILEKARKTVKKKYQRIGKIWKIS